MRYDFDVHILHFAYLFFVPVEPAPLLISDWLMVRNGCRVPVSLLANLRFFLVEVLLKDLRLLTVPEFLVETFLA